MHKLITANKIRDLKEKNITAELPSKCPHCHTAYGEIPIVSFYYGDTTKDSWCSLYSIFFCPHCEKCFYTESNFNDKLTFPTAYLIRTYPADKSSVKMPESIEILSPSFVKIYKEAEIAEKQGLYEICGIGYRKALEFLVKDYALEMNPDKRETIISVQLANCIETFISNEQIKTLAKASAWIGNDETHYSRKHEDYNVSHLKAFIDAMVTYITAELTVGDALKLISNPK